ncbi:MAG TPA: sigma-70 family RNA polymerase sigma factor [Methyloceanibacter sp.]|nr:sigma-70 family RNA polymerase sigma factor [Methyloceanibacter sp.]
MPTGDNELAGWAAAGDADAFRVLLERHYNGIFRLAFRFTGNRADAEDIAQDVCLGLVDRLSAFRGEAKFSTWLYRIVVNACRDRWRHQATAQRATENFAAVEDLRRAADADRGQQMEWVREMLSRFSEDIRETAILVLAEQLSHGEVAAILGVKESTVSWRMHELRKGLKQMADHDR